MAMPRQVHCMRRLFHVTTIAPSRTTTGMYSVFKVEHVHIITTDMMFAVSVLREQWIRAKYERMEFTGETKYPPPSYTTGNVYCQKTVLRVQVIQAFLIHMQDGTRKTGFLLDQDRKSNQKVFTQNAVQSFF